MSVRKFWTRKNGIVLQWLFNTSALGQLDFPVVDLVKDPETRGSLTRSTTTYIIKPKPMLNFNKLLFAQTP